MSEQLPAEILNLGVMEPNLVSLSQDGDGEAFCKLVEPYEDRLFRQAFLICRDVSRAEDLAQETMVAVWESIGRFDQSCRLFTWLYAIMIRRHRKQIRKHRRRPLLFPDLETLNSGEPCTPLSIQALTTPQIPMKPILPVNVPNCCVA